MATRYLQSQHKDKRGRTSGDGRAIWNGTVRAGGITFDVSSRGTGATRLSPGAQVAGVPVKTGDASYGYSCGRADLDEMLGTALMSEIFYRSGLPTERTLCVIDFGDGSAPVTDADPVHRYTERGRYRVRLTVNDGRGGVARSETNRPSPCAMGIRKTCPGSYRWVNSVSVFSTRRRTGFDTNFSPLLRINAPGSRCASQRI